MKPRNRTNAARRSGWAVYCLFVVSLMMWGNAAGAQSGVRAWGSNGYGELGDGTTDNRYTPVAVSGLTGVTAISTGQGHSLALKSDGTVWAWGDNNTGQAGDG